MNLHLFNLTDQSKCFTGFYTLESLTSKDILETSFNLQFICMHNFGLWEEVSVLGTRNFLVVR